MPLIVFLDFDGVLHPTEAAYQVEDCQRLTIAAAQSAGLFIHCEALESMLTEARHPVRIVVHSSWRLTTSTDHMRALLGPVGNRVQGITSPSLDRELSILDYMHRRSIEPRNVLILDDQPELFSKLSSRLIVCEPNVGLPSAARNLQLAIWSNH